MKPAIWIQTEQCVEDSETVVKEFGPVEEGHALYDVLSTLVEMLEHTK